MSSFVRSERIIQLSGSTESHGAFIVSVMLGGQSLDLTVDTSMLSSGQEVLVQDSEDVVSSVACCDCFAILCKSLC